MNKVQTHHSRSFKATRMALMAAAGLAVTFSAIERSEAIERVRFSLGATSWERIGITGSGAVIGDFSGLPPLVAPIAPRTHNLLLQSNPIPLVFEGDGVPRLSFASLLEHDHQTATAGSMVANGKGATQPKGMAPNAQLLVGWFGIEKNSDGGFDTGPFVASPGGGQFDAMTWTLMAMTDQGVADALAASPFFSIEPYTVATVVNASLGREGITSRRGEDEDSRIFNIVASMTGATLVAPTSNDGRLEDDMDGGDDATLSDLGRVYSPGGASNVISVGSIARDFNTVLAISGKGPMQAQNYADVSLLYPTMDLQFENPFTPENGDDLESDAGIFRGVRSGVDIVAPGDQLNLPGFVGGSGFNTSRTSRLWVGTSFSSSIVAGAVGLMHELGEREGYSIHSVVTRAVLLNSCNKTSDGVGVGFDNMQQEDQMSDDKTSTTRIGLDEELGAGSLDLKRLLNQYHRGTAVTDYLPGAGIEGFSNSFILSLPATDSFMYGIDALGTDPNTPMVTKAMRFLCLTSLGGTQLHERDFETTDPWEHSNLEMTVAQRYGPFDEAVEKLLDGEFTSSMAMGRRDDPNLDGGAGDGGSGGAGGGGSRPIAPAEDDERPGLSGSGTRPFRTGWDHGNIGEGEIDLPIGLITPGSGISVTLTWNRAESVKNLEPSNFNTPKANMISFGSGGGEDGGSDSDPNDLDEFEYEDLNLELWRITNGPGGNTKVASSEGVWNNTECVFFDFDGGAFDSSSDGPFGNIPANYFVRIVYVQTLWDYGGFWFCTGGMNPQPMESIRRTGILNRGRAEVEYGLAWYVDFNNAGVEFLGTLDQDTGAVNIGIPGIHDNVDRMFDTAVGDINTDLVVDANDAALMIQNFGSMDPAFDINTDGIADALDLEMIALHVGEVAEERKIPKNEKKAERQRRKEYKKMVKERRKTHKKASKAMKKLGK